MEDESECTDNWKQTIEFNLCKEAHSPSFSEFGVDVSALKERMIKVLPNRASCDVNTGLWSAIHSSC